MNILDIGGIPTMKKIEDLDHDELRMLIGTYDAYVQDGNDKDNYADGWRPVCVEEFLNNEYQEILRVNETDGPITI